MNTYLAAALTLVLATASTSCASLKNELTGPPAANANVTVLQAADALTDEIFARAAPALTSEIGHLPPETQALAQAAFAILQKGIDEAIERGWDSLDPADKAIAQGVLHMLTDAQGILHNALHDATVAVPATTPLADPNGVPAQVVVPIADPNAITIVVPAVTPGVTPPDVVVPAAALVPVPNSVVVDPAQVLVDPNTHVIVPRVPTAITID